MSNAFATNHHWHAVTVDTLPKFKPTLLTDVTRWDYRAYFETHPVPDVIWAISFILSGVSIYCL